MKIGIEVQRLFRKQKFGIETSALQLIKRLQHIQPNTEFVIFAKDDVDKNCLRESPNLKIKTLPGKLFLDFEQVFLPLAAKHERVDLVHCTGNTAPYFSPVPIVQTLHDVIFMDADHRDDTWYRYFGNFYRRKLVPVITHRSHQVITVSNYEKQRIVNRLGIDEKKIRVIYNGIDEKQFHMEHDSAVKQKVRTRYGLPDKFILFLGNTSSRKNAARVIEAYTLYASQTQKPLPIATPGLNIKFISDHLGTLGFQSLLGNFITPGYIEDEHLPILYHLSTLFLYPSLSEGFGMPVIEAMACGTPVITSNISCLPEIAGNAGILVDPLQASAIANAMFRLLVDNDLRQEKIQQGLLNAARFNLTKTAEQVYEVYQQVFFYTQRANKPAAVAYEL